MNKLLLDLNCDMGESFGNFSIGNEEAIFPYITSCSIACGFHAGDPWHIDQTIERALKYGTRIGAHPSYPDLQGFGRRFIQIPLEELQSMVRYQIGALKAMVVSKGGVLSYVKPHGALYHAIAHDESEARCFLEAMISIDANLALMAAPNSQASEIADEMGVQFLPEAFADRRYQSNGSLLPRSHPQSLLQQVSEVQAQALQIVHEHTVGSFEGAVIAIQASSICLHGDHPQAPVFAKALNELLRVD